MKEPLGLYPSGCNQNPSKENDPEPFDDFPEEEMPIIDDTEVEVEASEEIPEAASSDEYVEAIAEAKKISSTHKKSPRKKLPLILACVGAFLVGIIGWLGWSYWVDRDTLATLTSDLMTAAVSPDSSGFPFEFSALSKRQSIFRQRKFQGAL